MLIEHATIRNEHQIMNMLWFSLSMIACSISIKILSCLMVVKYGTMLVKNQKLLRLEMGWAGWGQVGMMLIENTNILNEHQIMSMLWCSLSMLPCLISIKILCVDRRVDMAIEHDLMLVKYDTINY